MVRLHINEALNWGLNRPDFPRRALTRTTSLEANNIDKLRQVVAHLDSTRVGTAGEDDMVAGSNILVG